MSFAHVPLRFGDGQPREPIHKVHADASATEARFTTADRRFGETEQRLTRTSSGSEFVARIFMAGR